MHAGACGAIDGLGHEGGVEAVGIGDLLHRLLEGDDIVRGGKGLGVLEVNLMLAGGALVVGGFDFKPQGLQGQADLPAGVVPVVDGAQVEVAGFVPGFGGGLAVLVDFKEEEFALRAHVKGVSHVGGPLEHPLQGAPGVPDEGGAVGVAHIAQKTGHLALLLVPRQDGEGIQIGVEVLVRLMDAGEPLDGAAVDGDLVVYGLLDLGGGDGHVFGLAKNIGKLHADEVYALFLHHADDIFFGVLAHMVGSPFEMKKGPVSFGFRSTRPLD